MSFDFIIILLAGAMAGGFINGLAGFGTSLFALGWWLQIMPPIQAVAIVLVMSVASGLQGVWIVRRSIDRRRLAQYLIPALLGIPIGYLILQHIEARPLKIVVASFLLLYAGFVLTRRDLPTISRPTPFADAGVGFSGGILGAIAGLSGALPTMWLALRDWPRHQTRAVLQPYNVTVLALAALLLAIDRTYTSETLINILIALPATMLSAQFGLMIFQRLSDRQFRRLLVALMLVSGLVLLIREVL